MNMRKTGLIATLAALAALVTAGIAQAVVVTNFKHEPKALRGTYAPGGNCSRAPRITVDPSGLTYTWRGQSVHSRYIQTAVGMAGRSYQGISSWYFPFAQGYDDWGSLMLVFNPDERRGTLKFTHNHGQWNKLRPLTPLQAALVKRSPYAKCDHSAQAAQVAYAKPAASPQLKIGHRVNKPTPAQAAAIHRAMHGTMKCYAVAEQFCYSLSVVDLNDDGRPDLLVDYEFPYQCGSSHCKGAIVLAAAHGHADKVIALPSAGPIVNVRAGKHHGLHDLSFQGWNKVWKYDGQQYH